MATPTRPKKSPMTTAQRARAPVVEKVAAPRVKKAAAAEEAKAVPVNGDKAKPAKVKLVRDSFTIPKTEYAVLDTLKRRAALAGLPSKKSEVLRAGLMALAAMGDVAFNSQLSQVPTLKTGRPKSS